MNTSFNLNDLALIIANRAEARDNTSYTASLVTAGIERAAKKLGEEAVEVVIAALTQTPKDLIAESADLLYHLGVVWHMKGIAPEDVLRELESRTGQSGLAEKVARTKTAQSHE